MTARTELTLNAIPLATAVPEAYVLQVTRPLVGKRRHSRVEIPGRAGSWIFDEEPGDRVLEIEVDLQAVSIEARREAVRALAYWCDIGSSAPLVISDEPDRYHVALLDDDPDPEEWLARARARLRFLVGPYALANDPSSETLSATTNPDSDTFSIPDTVTAEPVIELTPTGGNVSAFSLNVNGYVLSWAGGPILAGETLTISAISDTVTLGANDDVDLTGAFDVSDLDMADVSGEFPLLLEGSNAWALSWTGTATAVTLEVTWRERFR